MDTTPHRSGELMLLIKRIKMKVRCWLYFGLLWLLFSAFASVGRADSTELSEGRLMMGFFAPSMTQEASLKDIELSLNYWTQDFIAKHAAEWGVKITQSRAILFDTVEEMKAALQRGELDLIVAPPLLLARYFDSSDFEPDCFTQYLAENRPDSIMLIGRKPFDSVGSLRNKHLVLLENDELIDVYIDSLFLQEFGKSVQRSTRDISRQVKASRILLDLYFDKADAGVVYLNVWEVMTEQNPDIADKLGVIDRMEIKGKNFSFFRRGYPFAHLISNMAVNSFQHSPESRQIMEVFKSPALGFCSVDDLLFFKQYYQHYIQQKGRINP